MPIIRFGNKTNEQEMAHLLSLWETSTRATHHFLSEQMLLALRPFVKDGLQEIQKLLVLVNHNDEILGFMGIHEQKLEMLFLAPAVFGKGYGKQLLNYATQHFNVQEVDVNEQNPKAAQFYLRMGFEITGRSEIDGQGNPFPILHLRLKNTP